MKKIQRGIIDPILPFSIYLEFDLSTYEKTEIAFSLNKIAAISDGDQILVGIGSPLTSVFGIKIPGLRTYDALVDPDGNEVSPATQAALFLQIRGSTLEDTLEVTEQILTQVGDVFVLVRRTPAFRFAGGRDLTGYEDGTENPAGDDAFEAAYLDVGCPELDGSSFLALQKWVHDLKFFRAQDPDTQDEVFGRRISDNSEIEDAPEAAHIKRTEQESFSPEAFILRRSMMWSVQRSEGIMFTSYSSSLRPFDVQMQRMVGMEDGIVDNLFKYSTATTGAFYWCPPKGNHGINLAALGV